MILPASRHPSGYRPSSPLLYDVALLQLASPVQFVAWPHTGMACLPYPENLHESTGAWDCYALGWDNKEGVSIRFQLLAFILYLHYSTQSSLHKQFLPILCFQPLMRVDLRLLSPEACRDATYDYQRAAKDRCDGEWGMWIRWYCMDSFVMLWKLISMSNLLQI